MKVNSISEINKAIVGTSGLFLLIIKDSSVNRIMQESSPLSPQVIGVSKIDLEKS